MRGNQIGKLFSVTSFGESHGPAIGAVIDGVPGGLAFDIHELKSHLARRAPGQHEVHSARQENDEPEILSGIFEHKTLGSPICVIVRNLNQRPQDYHSNEYRPGHADKTTQIKYGIRDYRGGGRASGRETIARVIGGYFASLILPQVSTSALITQIGTITLHDKNLQYPNPLNLIDSTKTDEVTKYLMDAKAQGESYGGKLLLSIQGVPAGLGEPCFDKLKADLAKAMMSIGGCLGVSLGAGFEAADLRGSELSRTSQSFGGIEGGMSNGETIQLLMVFKAPSTIGEKAKQGRHDPCILPRVAPVTEAMAKIIVADHYLRQNAYFLGR